ncbi:hypothetical protein ACFWWC_00775 [Streptomyces sp. NPDC058642]|uniref:hypothetical protein n=1 Tax=Streptomyces sp. NPDC058642 TaxID=3346572 RepID=UPI00365D7F0E
MAGNLGLYQDITTAAGKAGGVDKLIGAIEAAAVAKAFPRAFGKGAGVGAAGALVAVSAAVALKRSRDDRRAREALANEAKEQLKAEVEDKSSPDGWK